MAYVSNPKELDPNAPVQLSGAGSAPMGGAVGAQSVRRAPSTSSGGGFTNVQAYLNSAANRRQGAQMGQNLASDAQREVGEASSALERGVNQFNTDVGQNTVNFDEGQVEQTISSGAANPYTTRALSGTYAGPSGLSRAEIDKETGEAQARAQALASQGGRADYLRELSGRNQSIGVSRLNNAFVNTNPDAISSIYGARREADALGGRVSEAAQAAAARAQAARETNQATRGQVTGRINTFLDTQEGNLEQQNAARQAEAIARRDAATNYLRALSTFSAGKIGAPPASTFDPMDPNAKWKKPTPVGPGVIFDPNAPINPVGPTDPLGDIPSTFTPPTGFEMAGLTDAQAKQLLDMVSANRGAGAQRVDMTQYYTPGNITGLNPSQGLSQQEAARLNALAALTGRRGFTSAAPVDASGNFAYDAAVQALRANYMDAVQNRKGGVLPNPYDQPLATPVAPAPVAPAPVPVVPVPAPAPVPTGVDGLDGWGDTRLVGRPVTQQPSIPDMPDGLDGWGRVPAPAPPAPTTTPTKIGAPVLPTTPTKWTGMADGGPVEGPGGPRDDMVPANLSNGEYVIPSHVVDKLGQDFFDKMLSTYKR